MLDNESFIQYFQQSGVRIEGTQSNPLFCVTDVGNMVNDINIRKRISKYSPTYIVKVKHKSSIGRNVLFNYFTILGLYRYLYNTRAADAHSAIEFIENYIQNIFTKNEQLKVI